MDELYGKLQKKMRNRQNCHSHSVDNRVLQLVFAQRKLKMMHEENMRTFPIMVLHHF